MSLLADQLTMIDAATALELRGRVAEARGLALRVADLPAPVGAAVRILTGRGASGGEVDGEVVGFDADRAIVMPLGSTSGIRQGDAVIALQHQHIMRVGPSVLGRTLDGLGRPIDGINVPLFDTVPRSLAPRPIDPLDRPLIDQPLATGVRAIDSLLSVGRGQRIGIFSAPGLGKSVLLGLMARHTSADVNVIALVGERGREVRDFLENNLGPRGIERSVVICATGDEPALMRLRAAQTAMTVAEYFRDQGKDVLFIMDSVTRYCQAQRQVGLAAGEPPATKGYPPSVFAMLPTLLERAGRTSKGSITGFFAVLVEGDDMTEPIADATRGILDGHIILDRKLAARGHWPAIDVLQSISRLADDVTDKEHLAARREVLKLLASYNEVEELLTIGAYAKGTRPDFDLAIELKPNIDQLLQQSRGDVIGGADFKKTRGQLLALGQLIAATKQKAAKKR